MSRMIRLVLTALLVAGVAGSAGLVAHQPSPSHDSVQAAGAPGPKNIWDIEWP